MFCQQTLKLPDQRRQCPLLPPLWAEVRHRVAFRGPQRQQIGDEWHVLLGRRGAGEQGFEFPQLGDRADRREQTRMPARVGR